VHDLVEKSALEAIASRKRKAEFAAMASEANIPLGLSLDSTSDLQEDSLMGMLKRGKIDPSEDIGGQQ
jgi:hypothetical protein